MLSKALSALPAPEALLFDLDGTLLDTAPDMVGALNALRQENELTPLALSELRQYVSKGSIGLLEAGMPACDETQTGLWQQRFLELYSQDLSGRTGLFAGMDKVLTLARDRQLKLAIVTNKPGWLTDPLLEQLELNHWFGSIVSGDSLPRRKPDPLPVEHACAELGVTPSSAWMLGDDERDILAGRRAGAVTVAASYGYVLPGEDAASWAADAVIDSVDPLLQWLTDG